MLLDTSQARLTLEHNQLARLTHACDTRVHCVDGVAWITIDRDSRDVVLSRGQSFVVDRASPVIVHAIQGPAAIELHAQAGVARCIETRSTRRTGGWRDWWSAFAAPAAGAV